MNDMDDIDFWTFDFDTSKQHHDQEILDRPQSTISTLPSEDEMIYEDSYNYNDVCDASISDSFASNSGLNNDSIVNVKYWENPNNEVTLIKKSTNDIGLNLGLHAQDDKLELQLESSSEQLEKYELKKEKNRQSAKRSRERRKEECEALKQKNTRLQKDNTKLHREVGNLKLQLALLNVHLINHNCCIQEQGDDTYYETGAAKDVHGTKEDNETGAAKDVPWTQQDDEVVELIDSFNFPGLTRKYPVEEAQYESQPNVYTSASNYNYFNEKHVDHCAASKMFQAYI